MKDTAKNQLKKTLTDLRKEELEKIDKKFEAKEEMKRVATAMTFHQEDSEHKKRSPLDNDCDQVYPNIYIYEISFACFQFKADVNLNSKVRSQLCKALEEMKFEELRARRARNERKPKYRDFTNINGTWQLGRREDRVVVTIQYIMESL